MRYMNNIFDSSVSLHIDLISVKYCILRYVEHWKTQKRENKPTKSLIIHTKKVEVVGSGLH